MQRLKSWGQPAPIQTRFAIGWENNRDGDITMPLSLNTIGSAGYGDQRNKKFGWVQVNRKVGIIHPSSDLHHKRRKRRGLTMLR